MFEIILNVMPFAFINNKNNNQNHIKINMTNDKNNNRKIWLTEF